MSSYQEGRAKPVGQPCPPDRDHLSGKTPLEGLPARQVVVRAAGQTLDDNSARQAPQSMKDLAALIVDLDVAGVRSMHATPAGNLRVEPGHALTPELRARLAAAKPALLACPEYAIASPPVPPPDHWTELSNEDHKYLSGPRFDVPNPPGGLTEAEFAEWKAWKVARHPEPCPWCGGRLTHNPLCFARPTPPGEILMPFGKHKGKPLGKLPRDYVFWCAVNLDSVDGEVRAALEALAGPAALEARRMRRPPRTTARSQGPSVAATLPVKRQAKPTCNHTLDCHDPKGTWVDEAVGNRVRVICGECGKFYGYRRPGSEERCSSTT